MHVFFSRVDEALMMKFSGSLMFLNQSFFGTTWSYVTCDVIFERTHILLKHVGVSKLSRNTTEDSKHGSFHKFMYSNVIFQNGLAFCYINDVCPKVVLLLEHDS